MSELLFREMLFAIAEQLLYYIKASPDVNE
jgi:hypothetical protein